MKYHNNNGAIKPTVGTANNNAGDLSPLKVNNVIFEEEEQNTPKPAVATNQDESNNNANSKNPETPSVSHKEPNSANIIYSESGAHKISSGSGTNSTTLASYSKQTATNVQSLSKIKPSQSKTSGIEETWIKEKGAINNASATSKPTDEAHPKFLFTDSLK